MQKLYYLKSSLVGKAVNILRDFELNENAYQEACNYFNRYENKRAIIRTYFRELLNIQPIKGEHEIRRLLDDVNLIVRGLRICNESVDGCMSAFITYYVSTKGLFSKAA